MMQQFGGTREILCERARIVNRDADLGDAITHVESPCAKQEPRYNAQATRTDFYFRSTGCTLVPADSRDFSVFLPGC